jgi:hypothetical protein
MSKYILDELKIGPTVQDALIVSYSEDKDMPKEEFTQAYYDGLDIIEGLLEAGVVVECEGEKVRLASNRERGC